MAAPDGIASSRKHVRREGFRYYMELKFPLKEGSVSSFKGTLATKRRRSIDNVKQLPYLLNLAEKEDH